MRHAWLAVAALACTACASVPDPLGSYVAPLPRTDAEPLAHAVADWLADQLPAAHTVLLVADPQQGQAENAITVELMAALRRHGFALVHHARLCPEAHRVLYRVEPIEGRVLVRVRVDDLEAARVFTRDAQGHVLADSALTVRGS